VREGRACDVAGQRGGAHVVLAEALQRRRPVRRLGRGDTSAHASHRKAESGVARRAHAPVFPSSAPAGCCRPEAAAARRWRCGRPAARRRGRRPRAPPAKATTRGPSRTAATPAKRAPHRGSAAAATPRGCGAAPPARAPAGRQNGARVGFWRSTPEIGAAAPRDPRRHRRARCGARRQPLREGRAWRRHGAPQASKAATASCKLDTSLSGGTATRAAARDISVAPEARSPAGGGSDGRRNLGQPRFSQIPPGGKTAQASAARRTSGVACHVWHCVQRVARQRVRCGGTCGDAGRCRRQQRQANT
jgi:hypothetical protein